MNLDGEILAQRKAACQPSGIVPDHVWGSRATGRFAALVLGRARSETDHQSLQAMCDAYSPEYDYPIIPAEDGVRDSSGLGGPAHRVVPRVVFGWDQHMTSPTRWIVYR